MIRAFIGFVAVVAAIGALPASAQTAKPLDIEISNGWTHKQSGIALPSSINGLSFGRATQFDDAGADIALQYNDPDLTDIVSVYIYQAAVQDVALLFAESRQPLETRKNYYGNLVPLGEPTAFAPPGQATASGLILAFDTDAAFRSTALAIAPLGRDWIVKFRVSSKSKSAVQLEAAMHDAIEALSWPKDDRAHPVPAAMADCAIPLPEFKKKAKRVKSDGGNAILNAVLAGMMSDDNKDALEVPIENLSHCRDRSISFDYAIYRPEAAADRYLVSLGDSGRAVFVEPDTATMLLGATKKGSTSYTIRFVGPGTVEVFPTHDRMPSPQQAFDIMEKMAPVSRTGRDGNSPVEIDSSALD